MQPKPFCEIFFSKDILGEDMLVTKDQTQIKMSWEKPYIEECVDTILPYGDVLEIGFGCGYAATHIQTYFPKTHTIIESHPEITRRARSWLIHHPNTKVIEGQWALELPSLGVYDAIFFDDYEVRLNHNHVPHHVMDERLLVFLELCLKNHMRKGSRFSCFMHMPQSKYKDKNWFEKIIANPFIDYVERRFSVDVPLHCQYYQSQEVLVMTVIKK